jgi:hypothetical protein
MEGPLPMWQYQVERHFSRSLGWALIRHDAGAGLYCDTDDFGGGMYLVHQWKNLN